MSEQRTTSEIYQDLYAGLGHLFYSIAAADGRVRPDEADRLKELIASQWLRLEDSRDDLGTDAAYYIEFSFDDAHDHHMPPQEAFDRFRSAYAAHHALIGQTERELIVHTARSIARAFAGPNKAEVGYLAQLEQVLKQH